MRENLPPLYLMWINGLLKMRRRVNKTAPQVSVPRSLRSGLSKLFAKSTPAYIEFSYSWTKTIRRASTRQTFFFPQRDRKSYKFPEWHKEILSLPIWIFRDTISPILSLRRKTDPRRSHFPHVSHFSSTSWVDFYMAASVRRWKFQMLYVLTLIWMIWKSDGWMQKWIIKLVSIV